MAVDMFLKIEGVKGESTVDGHEGEIDIYGWHWGMSNSGSMHVATGGGSGKVDIQDITISKKVDTSSPVLMQFCSQGKHFPNGTLTVRKAGGDRPVDYLTIKMDKIFITSYTTGGSEGDDTVNESISLNFSKYELTYKPQNEDGTPGADVITTFDIAKYKV
jgi:type VI secretion system secreted protein Hcp